MKYVAQIVGAICLTALIGGCMSMIYLLDNTQKKNSQIVAVECVKAGGEWVYSWPNFECIRKK